MNSMETAIWQIDLNQGLEQTANNWNDIGYSLRNDNW